MTRAEEDYFPVPYSHEVFQSLGELEESLERLKQRSIKREILGEMRKLFHKHNVASVLGLNLLHRHFDVNDDEMVVEYGKIATPWQIPREVLVGAHDVDRKYNIELLGGNIVPRCWKFGEGGDLYPTEFGFNPPRLEDTTGPIVGEYDQIKFKRGFIDELGAFLQNNELENVFGLTVLDRVRLNDDIGKFRGIERTIGRVSITITVDPADTTIMGEDGTGISEKNDALETVLKSGGIEAVWTFGCHEDLSNSTVLPNVARICWVCQGCKKKA
ncbi:hypothetical protein DFH27DRAFT_526952 [Peziza echinospora]|nr:hypothetical protein DFH27DRAFT_526952 [Peziza echinospora]